MNEFLNIDELSQYLSIRKSTLYSMVERGEIPCFRFRRLIRFKRQEIDAWTETHRERSADSGKKGKEAFRGIGNAGTDIDRIVQKSVESVKNSGYNHGHGKPDQVKGLRKEVEHGSL